MKTHLKLLALFLMLLMLTQSAIVTVFAVAPVDGELVIYAASGTQPTKYSKDYNSGTRDVVATTLNGTSADAYYSGSYEYDMLSTKSSTEIKNSLSTLMKSTHSYTSSYNDCHYKADRTDCENEDGRVSLIYTGYSATMSQWNGWNREHVWPQSLGGGNTSGGGADLHHIRPSDAVVNSTRGNKKYGYANGGSAVYGKNPATGVLGGYSGNYYEPLDNVKGDVARIVLYVWVRWGSSWGADSVTEVFQSVDVLLEWCELDPVDTWELGRNEVIQDIQGNRNVFIDYPEYAWLIFGEEVPEDMVTPSGEASEGACQHDWKITYTEATCTTQGTKVSTCTLCGKVETVVTAAALGHSNIENITKPATCTTTGSKTVTCSVCNKTETKTIAALGHSYGDWIIDKEATETESGAKHRICATCDYVENATIPNLTHEHSYTDVVTPPTCEDEGYTTHTCSCGDQKIDSYKDKLDHSYSNGTCIRCGKADPSAPVVTADDFSNLVTKLFADVYTGQEKYIKICEAVNIYSKLSNSDKETVSGDYSILVSIVSQYNKDAKAANSDSKPFGEIPDTVAVAVALLPFAAYTLLTNKEF